MKFKLSETSLPEVFIIEPQSFEDDRGFFMESYNQAEFAELGINDKFIQDNQSFSKQGVLRGLHFQTPPKETSKLVRCIRGEIYDVVVDMRKNSENFGKWEGFALSAENKKMVYIPRGFAHGFCALTDAEVVYKVDEFFSKENDGGIRWNDPDIGIKWPLEVAPILSSKDAILPYLKEWKNP